MLTVKAFRLRVRFPWRTHTFNRPTVIWFRMKDKKFTKIESEIKINSVMASMKTSYNLKKIYKNKPRTKIYTLSANPPQVSTYVMCRTFSSDHSSQDSGWCVKKQFYSRRKNSYWMHHSMHGIVFQLVSRINGMFT